MFHRVQLRSIGGKRFDLEAGIGFEYGADVGTAMAGPAVPDQDDAAADVMEQMPQEVRDGRSLERAVDDRAEVEAEFAAERRQREGGDDRHLLAVSAADEEFGRLAFGREGAADERPEHHAAFVDENNGGPLAFRPF